MQTLSAPAFRVTPQRLRALLAARLQRIQLFLWQSMAMLGVHLSTELLNLYSMASATLSIRLMSRHPFLLAWKSVRFVRRQAIKLSCLLLAVVPSREADLRCALLVPQALTLI